MVFEYIIRPLLRPIKELTTDFTVFRCGRGKFTVRTQFSPRVLRGRGGRVKLAACPRLLPRGGAAVTHLAHRPAAYRPRAPCLPSPLPPRVRIVTRERAFSSAKARRLLGYTPATPLKEGIRRTVGFFKHLRADAPPDAKAK
jgi:hypothetical protein